MTEPTITPYPAPAPPLVGLDYVPAYPKYWLDVAVPAAAARLRKEVAAEDRPYRSGSYPW